MKCERCGAAEATTQIYKNVNGQKSLIRLCDKCAREYAQISGHSEMSGLDIFQKLLGGSSIGLLSNLTGLIGTTSVSTSVCPECHTTSEEFLHSGFVGCPHCYEAFEPLIVQAVKQFQYSDRHIGKSGKSPAVDDGSEEAKLTAEIHAAMANHEYKRVEELSRRLNMISGDNGNGGNKGE